MTSNLIIVNETGHQAIIDRLISEGVTRAHFTNGAYSFPEKPSAATTLVGYQYLRDKGVYRDGESVAIAVNSNESLYRALDQKIAQGSATAADKDKIEDQLLRAMKPAGALARQMAHFHPDEKVIVCFYDEDTPTPLYEAINLDGRVRIGSLHKNGYGTDPKAGKIEGAEFAETVFGFPLPNDGRPLYHDLTAAQTEDDIVRVAVAALKTEIGPHGSPYITPDFSVLIPLAPALRHYAPQIATDRDDKPHPQP